MSKTHEHIVSVDGVEYVPRMYAVAKCVQGGQLCPKCGEKKNYVYDSRLDYKYKGVFRKRKCMNCGYSWKTLEIMYPNYERSGEDEQGDCQTE